MASSSFIVTCASHLYTQVV